MTPATYPDIEIQISISDRLDIESDSRNGGNDFANLETRDMSIDTVDVAEQL